MLERLLGLDHPEVASQYSTLAMYYHSCGYFQMSFTYMYRSLSILQLIAGDYHPEIAAIHLNLGLMYQEVDQAQATLECYNNSLQQNMHMYSEENIQTASSFQALAQSHFKLQDGRKGLAAQEKAVQLLQKILPAEANYVKQAKGQLDYYFRLSVDIEKRRKF